MGEREDMPPVEEAEIVPELVEEVVVEELVVEGAEVPATPEVVV